MQVCHICGIDHASIATSPRDGMDCIFNELLTVMTSALCPICALHDDPVMVDRYEIQRSNLWILRHHPDPAPLPGWLLLDTFRHCSGPIDFTTAEMADWGRAVHDASQLIQALIGCDRVYCMAFGEGAQHLHLHLIPRFVGDPDTSAWSVADHYLLCLSRLFSGQ